MDWLKKVTLFILSALLLIFSSCESVHNKSGNNQEEISKEDLINNLFNSLQTWNESSIPLIDSIGFEISKMDSSLSFLPYLNEYEKHSFVFVAKDRNELKSFEESSFLSDEIEIEKSGYSVWRKKTNEVELLDISIEPHPSLGWLLVIRKRGQE